MDRIEIKAQLTVDEAGTITGIAWPFGSPDRVGDVIEKGAFASSAVPLPMLDTHDQAKVVGVWDEISETPEGLTVKGRLLIEDVERAREVRALVQAGAMRGLSIGFSSTKALPRKGGGRTIQGLDLLEISVVAVPAHPAARITSAKDMNMAGENDGIAALEVKMTEIEKKTDTSAIVARLDKIEAKMNRPQGGADAKAEPTEERKAFVSYLRRGPSAPVEELKALNESTDSQGGYLTPPELSTEIIRELVEFSPVRTVASIRSTTAPSVTYPTRGDITNAAWVGELQDRPESTITFGQTELQVHELGTFVEISKRLLEDTAGQAEAEVRLALSEDFGKKEATAFVTGDGVGEPEGFLANAEIAEFNNGHASNIAADALISLLYSIPATYRNRGAWALNGTTLGVIRRLKDGQGNYLWQPSYQVGQPETILGRPVIELVDMPDVAPDAVPIVYGDFSGYRILDRVDLSVLVDPYTRAKNGITVLHARRRVGGGVLQPSKFRKFKMAV